LKLADTPRPNPTRSTEFTATTPQNQDGGSGLSGGGGAAATTGDVGAALDAFAADLSDFVDDLVKDVGRAAKIDDSRNL